jgi:hypothetical protein
MTDNQTSKTTTFVKPVLRVYLLLFVMGGMITMVWIVKIPEAIETAAFLGLSVERMVLLGCVLLVTGVAAWVFMKAMLHRSWFSRWAEMISNRMENDRFYGGTLLLAILGFINGLNMIPRLPERLQPAAVWITFLFGLTLLISHLIRHGFNPRDLGLRDPGLLAFGLVFGVLVALAILISATSYGITPIDVGIGWYPVGTPLLVTQVFMAWGIAMGMLAIWTWSIPLNKEEHRPLTTRHVDFFLCVVLWLAAFILWTSQPLKPNWFASEPRPPNHAFYPNSDASVYDISAQNLLLGEGFKTRSSPFTIRPAYAAFLAFLHGLGGPTYEAIIWMQVAVLALIPAFFYRITTRLHNRFSGLLGALMLVLRETNAINLGDTISDAHAKLLMPFLPTTFGVLLTLWVTIRWMQDPAHKKVLPLISGGLVGMFMLIRPEFGVFIPFIAITALLQMRKHPIDWMYGIALIILGVGLSLSPWIWRNYQLTGTIFIDSPTYRLDLITKRYREEPLGFVPTPIPEPTSAPGITPTIQADDPASSTPEARVPTETSVPQASTTTLEPTLQSDDSVQHQTGRLLEDVIDFIASKPAYLTDFILKHFLNSQVQTVLNLPVSYPITDSAITTFKHRSLNRFWRECCTLEGYQDDLPFWQKWDGVLPRLSLVPLGLNLFFIALGISISWRNHRFTGLVPLAGSTGYYLVNAVVRNSGGRYILPVDWVSYCYFAIGLTEATRWGIAFFSPRMSNALSKTGLLTIQAERPRTSRWSVLWFGCVFLLLGLSLPIMERVIPSKYEAVSLDSRVDSTLEHSSGLIDESEVEILLTYLENGGTALYGNALYPRFHNPNQMGSVWYFYQERPYPNLDFYLSSPHDTGIVLRVDQSPLRFPHATDTLVFACPEYLYADALAIILFDKNGSPTDVLWRSPLPERLTCPLPSP